MERRYAGKLAYFCAMKIALAQQNYHIGNFSANVHKIVEAIAIARSKGADLILFSELAVCGYPPRDFLEFNDFIDKFISSDTLEKGITILEKVLPLIKKIAIKKE